MKVGGDEQEFTTKDTIDEEFLKTFVKTDWPVRMTNSKFGTLND